MKTTMIITMNKMMKTKAEKMVGDYCDDEDHEVNEEDESL